MKYMNISTNSFQLMWTFSVSIIPLITDPKLMEKTNLWSKPQEPMSQTNVSLAQLSNSEIKHVGNHVSCFNQLEWLFTTLTQGRSCKHWSLGGTLRRERSSHFRLSGPMGLRQFEWIEMRPIYLKCIESYFKKQKVLHITEMLIFKYRAISRLFFFIFVFSMQLMVNKICRWPDSNLRSLVLEATACSTEPLPLHIILFLLIPTQHKISQTC